MDGRQTVFGADSLALHPFTATLLDNPGLRKGLKAYTFSVSYHGPFGVDAGSFDDDDILVTGPDGFAANARFVSDVRGKRGSTRIVTYALDGPGIRWDAAENGTYTIHIRAGQVTDGTGNAVPADHLETFDIAIPASVNVPMPQPAMKLVGAPPLRRGLDELLA